METLIYATPPMLIGKESTKKSGGQAASACAAPPGCTGLLPPGVPGRPSLLLALTNPLSSVAFLAASALLHVISAFVRVIRFPYTRPIARVCGTPRPCVGERTETHMTSLLEQLPKIVAEGKREAERILERLESSYRIGLQTRELVIPSRDTSWQDMFVKADRSSQNLNPAEMNRLIYGDNLLAMAALLAGSDDMPSMRGKVDLIYIDPPFDSKADYRTKVNLPGGDIEQKPTAIEQFAYSDTWQDGTASYLSMIVPRLYLMREFLKDTGSIVVHIDWHVGHYVKLVMDDIYGKDNFVNEIVWKRKGGSANPANRLGVVTDSLFWFSKSERPIVNQQFTKESDEAKKYIEERFNNIDEKTGRRYLKSPIVSPNPRPNLTYDYKGYKPPANGWSISREIMEKWDNDGKLYFPPKGSGDRIYRKIFLDEYQGQPIQNLWTDVFVINPVAKERLEFATQKPEALTREDYQSNNYPFIHHCRFLFRIGNHCCCCRKIGP